MARKDPKQKTRHNACKCSCEMKQAAKIRKLANRLARKADQDHKFRFYVFVIFPNE